MRRLLLACALLTACGAPKTTLPVPLAAGLPVPPILNGRALPERDAGAPLHFLVAGHLYGDPQHKGMPADSFVAAIPELARSGADLLVCCGDTFRIGVAPCFDATAAQLQRLPFAVFNAVGNHDVTDRAGYRARFGATHGAFVHAGCLFVVLDTELQPWEIEGAQLDFLRQVLAAAAARDDLRAVFCFAHKLVFAHRQRYFDLVAGGNAIDGLSGPNHFAAEVLPLLTACAEKLPVYWCAGDIGTAHTLPAFCDRDPQSGVTFLATGIGDLPRDALLDFTVVGGDVHVALRSLTGQPPLQLAAYDLAAWSAHVYPDGMPAALAALRASLPP